MREMKSEKAASNKHVTDTSNGSIPSISETPKSETTPSWAYWVVIGVVVLAAGGVAWYFVRRKLFSHDIEQRYALYLSTLAYQQIRVEHGGDLELANAELGEHLHFMRGDLASSSHIANAIPAADGTKSAFFESVQALPLPIKVRPDHAFVAFLKKADTFV